MHRKFKQLGALVVLAPSVAMAQAEDQPFAIRCAGTAVSKHAGVASHEDVVRRYILDPSGKMISYWNEDQERAIEQCKPTIAPCEVSFGPRYVDLRGNLTKTLGTVIRIDRRTGWLREWFGTSDRDSFEFSGKCEKVEMPGARTLDNKF